MFSFKNKELINIANGIDSCAPIVIGANIETALIDKYKNKLKISNKPLKELFLISDYVLCIASTFCGPQRVTFG